MFDRLKNCLFDLVDSAKRIFFKLFNSKDFINIFTKIHPFDSFFSAAHWINTIYFNELFVLIFRKVEIHAAKNSSELSTSNDIFPKTVKI